MASAPEAATSTTEAPAPPVPASAPAAEPVPVPAAEPTTAPAPAQAATSLSSTPSAATATAAVKLKPIPLSSLPTASNDLSSYLSSLHKQAYDLVNVLSDDKPKPPWKHHSTKKHENYSVDTFARDEPSGGSGSGGETEHWFARRSVHDLSDGIFVEEGGKILKWADFTNYLLENHAENEQNYIASVRRVDRIMDASRFPTSEVPAAAVPGWKDFKFSVVTILHHLPWPLNPRIFPIALYTAIKEDGSEFIVVSLPVDLPKDTEGEVVGPDFKSTKKVKVLEGTTVGRYVAIELVRRVDGEGAAKKAIWCMATASDAEGNLPMSVQKRSIPGTIAKDVPWFCEWVEKKGAKA